ncbi:11135_t:CDS:2 [Funneliformis caledonium]|uniref:11135_t:CDS:1 n=1 Tax=Funneliformis caledonium TaxID=1117310 RepID=A0A9N9DWT8_9GLOM|nr:11135_t:CDS:2 [Funneliformis caledonium]
MGSGGTLTLSSGRGFMIFANTLTTIAGLILIGLGLYGVFSSEVRLYSSEIPIATIVLGFLVLLISITGCCGAFVENRPILYFIMLLILIIAQIIIAIVVLADRANVEDILNNAWQKAYDDHPSIIRDIEDEYSCCGFKNITDRAVPKSSPDACVNSPWFGYDRPCLENLSRAYRSHNTMLGVLGIILAIIQILALISAYILIAFLPNAREREYQYLSEHDRIVRGFGGVGGKTLRPQDIGQQSTSVYGST